MMGRQSNTVRIYNRKLVSFFFIFFAVLGLRAQELPAGAPAVGEVRFVAVGDTGNGNDEQTQIARQMLAAQEKSRYELIVFLGDNIYPSGSPKDFGRKFAVPYRSFIENETRMRAVVGNHDARSDEGVLLQQMMFGMGGKTYYSFTEGGDLVEFFALDSNPLARDENAAAKAAQLEWLGRALAASKAHWKIVLLHHALYSSAKKHGWNSGDEDEMQRVRRAIEPLLEKHGVRIVIGAHDHVYERTKPQKGIYHFVSGAGSEVRRGDLQTNSPFYEFGNDREPSFMLFSVKPEAVTFWAVGIAGTIIDRGEIRRE